MKRIVAILPIHARERVTMETIGVLRGQKYVTHVVAAGDGEPEERTAKKAGAVFVRFPNEPLSFKFQGALDKARDFSPDAVLICGSDDFLSPRWTEAGYEKIAEGCDLVGASQWWHCVAMPGCFAEMRQFRYDEARMGEPIGAGRMISRRILELLKWKLFRVPRNDGCDLMSFKLILEKGGAVGDLKETPGVEAVCLKSTWPSLTAPEKFMELARNSSHVVLLRTVSDFKGWTEENFPGLLKHVRRVVPECRLGHRPESANDQEGNGRER